MTRIIRLLIRPVRSHYENANEAAAEWSCKPLTTTYTVKRHLTKYGRAK